MKNNVEAFDLFQYLLQFSYEPLIRCRIDFAGHIDFDILTQAVTRSMDSVPLLRCCFDDSRLRPRWVERDFTGEDIVHLVNAEKNKSIDEQITFYYSSNIDFISEPQLKIYVVRKTEGDTLCIIINHMICDGAGFKQYLYLLSELYTKLKNNKTLPVTVLHPRGLDLLISHLTLKEKWKILSTEPENEGLINTHRQIGMGIGSDGKKPYMEARVITKERFEKLRVYGKTRGATLNDLLMTLFSRSFCKNTQTEKIAFPSTMDLRRFIPADKHHGISNFSTNCMCLISVKADDPFIVTLKQVSEQMQNYKSSNIPLRGIIWWYYCARLIPFWYLKRNKDILKPPIVSFTNLGILDSSLLCFDDLFINSAYLSTAFKRSPFFQLIVSTYRDRIILGCSYYGDNDNKRWIDGIFDDIFSEMESLE